MRMTTAEQMVDILKHAGIRRIYGVPGDSLNFFNDALRRDGKIEWIHVRHEEAGAFAAMAEGALGGLGCCAGSAGPGHVHLMNGLYDAHRWGAPVLALASTIISEDYGSDSFQSTDLAMFNGCSYYNGLAQTSRQVPRMLQQALQHAWSNKGVSVFAFPGDLMTHAADKSFRSELYQPEPVIQPNNNEIQQLADLLNSTKEIGIYVGLGAIPAKHSVLELARKLQSPIAYTLKAKMTFDHENPFGVGMTGLLGSSAGAKAVTQGKLLLMLGSDFPWVDFLNGKIKVVQIDTKPERLGRRVPLHMGLTGDIEPTLQALLPLIKSKSENHFLKSCLNQYTEAQKTYTKHAQDIGEVSLIKPEYVTALVNKLAQEDAIFTVDTGMCTVWAARYLHNVRGRSLLGSFSHGSMANALPQAIGAALHSPNRQIIALCGDGGLSMLMGDLMTITQYRLPIKLIVFNNRALGMVELEMQVAGIPDWQTKMVNPNFAQIAEACGIPGYSVHEPKHLETQLKAALSSEGPALVEVFTNPYVPVLPPHTSVGVLSRYVESQIKLTANGRLREAWGSLKAAVQYLTDLI